MAIIGNSQSTACDYYTISAADDYYNYTVSAGAAGAAGTISIGAAGSSGPTITNAAGATGWSMNTILPTIKIEGTAEIDGDITVQGRSMRDWMSAVDKRLAILVPDPEKLKQFEALQKAYQHYKMLEALCEMPVVEDDE